MNIGRWACSFLSVFAALALFAGEVSITSVTAQQRYPWNGLVDIVVAMQGAADDISNYQVAFAATNSVTKMALPVRHITQKGTNHGADSTWIQKFIWDTNADLGEVKIDDVAMTVTAKLLDGVQLWEGGPYWAECNVGATKPEEYGYYFWWGDTVGYSRNAANNGWISVDDANPFEFASYNCPTCGKDNEALRSAGYIDESGNIVAKYDAATAHLGAPWRMPTDAEWNALIRNCNTTWTTHNGVWGRLVTGKGAYASKSIFLPASGNTYYYEGVGSNGFYWSSTPNSDYSISACSLCFESVNFLRSDIAGRYIGQPVRSVRGDVSFVSVSFDARGGVCETSSTSYEIGCQFGSLPTAQREGYIFDGWYTAKTGGDRVLETMVVEQEMTLYAHWSVLQETKPQLGGVQLWANGPYWAECNVGAENAESVGYFFWWGDTIGHKRVGYYSWGGFSFDPGNCPTHGKANETLRSLGYIDASGNLVAKYDAATAHLGEPWRMPTYEELSALLKNCNTSKRRTADGSISGLLVWGKGAYSSKSIFLPASGYGKNGFNYGALTSGYYWSSTPESYLSLEAGRLGFDESFCFCSFDQAYRYYGLPVRPVRDPSHDVIVSFDARGGVCEISSRHYEIGSCLGDLPMATRDGYVFDGWYTKSEADGDSALETTVVETGMTLYAHWTAIQQPHLGGVQLWKHGPYWSECNVGAAKPEEYGYYFWWGDTVGYKNVSSRFDAVDGSKNGFSFGQGNCPTYGKGEKALQSEGYVDDNGNLVAKYDAATAHLGVPWRMPTQEDRRALLDNCNAAWTTRNGVSGLLVTGKGAYASQSIFLPASGYGSGSDRHNVGHSGHYWTSRLSWWEDEAECLDFNSDGVPIGSSSRIDHRYFGYSVRPVRDFVE